MAHTQPGLENKSIFSSGGKPMRSAGAGSMAGGIFFWPQRWHLCWLLGPSVQKSGVCGNMISLSSHTGECLPILFSQGNLQGAKDMLRHAQMPSLVHEYSR